MNEIIRCKKELFDFTVTLDNKTCSYFDGHEVTQRTVHPKRLVLLASKLELITKSIC